MKIITSLALLAALVACEQHQSRLDKVGIKVAERSAEPAGAATTAAGKLDHSGTAEERLARLEDAYNKNAEALDFLNKVYAQQKAQQQAQQREEAAPDALFAVDIAPDVKAGMVEGSPQALVTIVEAWDFA